MNHHGKKIVLSGALAFLCALALVLVGCGNSGSVSTEDAETTDGADATGEYTLVKDGTLTCVSELGFAPFEYMEAGSTEPVGYDIDVANEIAKRLGLECEFLPTQAFDTLLPTISEGNKADIAIAGITIQDDRLEVVDFSDPYFESNLAIVVDGESDLTFDDLNAEDVFIACQTGTSGDAWIDENLPNAKKKTLDDVSAGLSGVVTGSYQAYVIDLPVAEKNLRDSFTQLKILEKIPTGEQYGIAISKDNPALTEAINAALADMDEDGTLQEIWDTWMVETEVDE